MKVPQRTQIDQFESRASCIDRKDFSACPSQLRGDWLLLLCDERGLTISFVISPVLKTRRCQCNNVICCRAYDKLIYSKFSSLDATGLVCSRCKIDSQQQIMFLFKIIFLSPIKPLIKCSKCVRHDLKVNRVFISASGF